MGFLGIREYRTGNAFLCHATSTKKSGIMDPSMEQGLSGFAYRTGDGQLRMFSLALLERLFKSATAVRFIRNSHRSVWQPGMA
jgi:hypothetical protein